MCTHCPLLLIIICTSGVIRQVREGLKRLTLSGTEVGDSCLCAKDKIKTQHRHETIVHYLVAFLFNITELQAGCIIIIVNGQYMFAYEWAESILILQEQIFTLKKPMNSTPHTHI